MALEAQEEQPQAVLEAEEQPLVTEEDIAKASMFQPPVVDDTEEPDPLPDPGPNLVIAAAAGQPDRESIELEAENNRLERSTMAVQALASVPQDPDKFKPLAEAILKVGDKSTYGEKAATLIQKNRTPEVQIELANHIDVDNGKNTLIRDILKSMGHKGTSYDEFMNAPSEAAKVATEIIVAKSPKLRERLNETYNEDTYSNMSLLEFVNPIGGDDPDGMDIEVWDAVKGILSGTFDAEAFDEQMTSNYGDEWGGRFFAWAAKEIAIDGALLLLAATGAGAPLAATIGVSRKAILLNRLSRTAKRAIYVGVGGGTIQSMQNIALDRDPNLALEIGVRAGGQAAGELIFKGIGQVYRAATGKNRASIISEAVKNRKIKPINEINMAKIYDGKQFDIATVPALIRAKIVGSVDRYEQIMGSTTRMIMDRGRASKEVKDSLATVLGKDSKELKQIDMDLILNDAIRLRDLSENARITAFANQDLNSRGMMGHAMAMTIGHRENMTQNVELFVSKAMAELRKNDGNINLSNWAWMETAMKGARIAEPSRTVKQSADNLFDVTNISNNLQKGFQRMYKDTLGHLTEREKHVVDAITKQGFADHTTYDLLSTTPQGMKIEAKHLTPRVIEAYNKTRFLFDIGHSIKDVDIVASLKGVVKQRKGKYYQILPNKKTKKGHVAIQEYSNATWRVKPDEESIQILKSTWDATDELTTILPYRNGYMPRAYASHNFSVIVSNPGKGTVAREALFNSGKEAEQYIKERTAQVKLKANKDPEEIVFKLWNNSDTGMSGFSASRAQMDLLNAVDDETRPVLRELLDSQGITEKAAKVLLDGIKISNPLAGHAKALTALGTATTKAGKIKRIALAKARKEGDSKAVKALVKDISSKESIAEEVLPTQEAFVEYLSSVAHSAGQNNFRKYVVEDFMDRYGKYLKNGTRWSKPEFDKTTMDAALMAQAHAMSRWMGRTFTRTTYRERKYDHVITRFANKFAERAAAGHRGSRALSWLLDHSPVMSGELTAFMRFSTAFPKLLSGNIAQVFVQLSQIIPSLGAAFVRRPVTAFNSILNLPGMGVIEGIHTAGKTIPRSMQKTGSHTVWKDLQQSGYVADLNMTDTLFNIQKHFDPSVGRQIWEGLKLVGQTPFRMGEGGNRVVAFTLAHGKITADIKAYTRALDKGITGKKLEKLEWHARGLEGHGPGKSMTTKDLGTGRFQQIVANRAAVTALSMGKAGELEAMSGFGSVAFQFRQVLPKTMSMFDSSQLTGKERFGALGAMVTMWGTGAIVLGPDILKATDWAMSQVFDTPKDRMLATDAARYTAEVMGGFTENYLDIESETTERWLRHGIVSAMTEGEINFTNRIALGNFLGEMVDIAHYTDLIVFAAVAKDMADAVATLGVAELLNPVSFLQLIEDMGKGASFQEAMSRQYEPEGTISKALAGETTFGNMTLQLTRDFGKVFSQMGSISRAMDAAHQDIVSPEIGRKNPMTPTYYTTSNLKATDVEVNDTNQFMLMLGISPGKLVESRNLRETEGIYKEAARNYAKSIDARYRAALGDSALQRRLIIEFTDEMNALKHLSVQLGISPTASLQSMSLATRKLMYIILDIGTGGEIKGGKYTPRRNK